MPMKAMKAAKAVAPPRRRRSTNAMKVPKAMKAMKAAPPKRRRSTKAMPVPKTPAKPKAKAKAKNDAKTKDGTIKVPFMGTGTTMMPDYARNAPGPPVDMAGGALPQVVLRQSWHIDTCNVPEIWIDAALLSQRAALPGDKILFKVFKLD